MDIKEYEKLERQRISRNLDYLEAGVRFIDIRTAYIEEGVTIGAGTVIYPCVVIEGDVTIGENCTIGQNSRIKDSVIGDDTSIQSSVILESKVGSGTSVGPFAYLRPNSEVGDGCKVGDFVEIKNSKLGDGAKAAHLTYVGDSDVGERVNLGCGVVFVNYDGSRKYRSVVEDGAFIGCNVNLVSPVHVGKDAYIAAGSTITEDVPDGALYVARAKGRTLEGWVEKKGILKK
ncbi:Bifunctional protein GlmU [uncultured Eubacterium sp.]|uniref:DapH/DapD/GlmU-related protein n=1 Tax=Brotomerdimonas butyrica TaxID=2981721 RepID=UPI0008208548|nr:DapH/DapD/GlmU-related protein [Brotomerdimonas butyrica]MCU6756168.1 UDP-N-acetylglucosamine diphosphorylase [Brotomerdimonas butyrica]SCH68992.1 Bifunctional protein GlmU [uncultured Eubacterium sp.]